MNRDLRFHFRTGDMLAILLVAALAIGTALAFVPRQPAGARSAVQIWHDGALEAEFDLAEERTLVINGDYENTITLSGGKVAITQSNCPGADCVHSGWIDAPGKSIVCLPNRVEIRVVGQADVDFVVG